MCEVYRSTFEMAMPLIADAVKNAAFVVIDTEFTGLVFSAQSKPSLFDTVEERYLKLKKAVTEFMPSQIGLSAFVKVPNENKYISHSFNTYLFPQSFGPVDVRFSCQASSLEFLSKHKFDFNKFAYEGVSFLNEVQEKAVKAHIKSQSVNKGLERDLDEALLQKHCSRVAEWLVHKSEGDTFILERDKESKRVETYLLQIEIRQRFPNVWTTESGFGDIVVEKVSAERRETLEKVRGECEVTDHDRVLNSLLGWTRVFRLLIDHQKPLIGHNMLMDLMFLFDKFYNPLPDSYGAFKKQLHELFPVLFDTKHIVLSSKEMFENTGLLESTALSDLYMAFDSSKGKFHTVCSPGIVHAEGFDRYKEQILPHEAGSDAFQCGYLFLRLAHILHFRDVKSTDVEPCSFRDYLHSLKSFQNQVNVIRGTVNHLNLDGADPVSRRPELIFVKSRKSSYSLSSIQLAKWFSAHGSVDVRLLGKQRALIATGNHRCAKDILKAFKKHELIYVTKYSPWKHSLLARNALLAGAVASGGICLWILWSSRKSS
ncbi:poly(A)-specific ribonuclease PNLDC1-like [Liolophura sinensis]|uniref:poly(A)-specific ribonuclease PNLDC1-like n=1 Tax=Liolophura sinensis TaxID=3198878 RepID=UPI0031599552